MDEQSPARSIFITGGTGHIGSRLIPELLRRGHRVRALVRSGSEGKLTSGCARVIGSALEKRSYVEGLESADTIIHLVGVPHPTPAKAAEFRSVDLAAAKIAVEVAGELQMEHFIYVSVAHPAPTMHAYTAVRSECESLIRSSGLNATILRPWYVLGPGHHWPLVLLPVYWVAEMIPQSRASALRLGLITLTQMVNSLAWSVEHPPRGFRILEVPDIRRN